MTMMAGIALGPLRISRGAPLDAVAGSVFAAFSYRLMSSVYSGPCIRVRRSTDNALRDFGFFASWLDVVALLDWVRAQSLTASGFVVTWYDQSGRGRHITQTTASAQRRIVNAGVLESFGGQPALAGGAGQYYASAWPVLPQPATIIATLKLPDYTVGQDQNLIRTNALATGYNGVPYIINSGGRVALYAGVGLIGATLVDNTAYALSWVMAGTASLVGTNGVYTTGDVGAEAINAAPNVFAGLGGAAPVIGQCGDLVVFNAALTQAQITSISRTLAAPRGIVVP